MSQVPVPNLTQPELAPPPGGSGQRRPPQEPRPSPIQQEIEKRLATLNTRQAALQVRLPLLEQEIRSLEPTLDILRSLKEVGQTLSRATRLVVLNPNAVLPRMMVSDQPEREVKRAELAALRQDIINLEAEAKSVSVQLAMSVGIPRLVRLGAVSTMEDVMSRFGKHLTTDQDRNIARRLLDRALQDKQQATASASRSQEDYIEALGHKRNLTVYGMMTLTTTPDLLGFVEGLLGPSLPEGGTIEEFRQVLGDAAIPLEFSQVLIDEAEDFTEVLNRELDIEATRRTVWTADLLKAIDEGEFAKILKDYREGINVLDHPGLYIGLPFRWLDRHYFKPIGGIGVHGGNIGGIRVPSFAQAFVRGATTFDITPSRRLAVPGVEEFFGLTTKNYSEFEGQFAAAKASGDSAWIAYGVAFENQQSNALGKIVVEIVADPTSYLGFGLLKSLKGVPVIGGSLYRFEHLWIRTWDLPFTGLQKGIQKVIPKLPSDIVSRDMADHLGTTLEWLNFSHPRGVPAIEMGMPRIKENMNLALRALQNNPRSPGIMTDAVRGLLEQPMLTADEVSTLATSLGKSTTDELLPEMLNKIDMYLAHTLEIPGGLSHSAPESIDLILSAVGADHTEDNIKLVAGLIGRRRSQALTRFEALITKDTYGEFTAGILSHRKNILVANQLNPLSAYRSRTAMFMSSLMSGNRTGAAVTTLAAGFRALHGLSYGFTRMYLMSTLYGPYNIAETAAKAAVMGITPWDKADGLVTLHRAAQGFETLLPRFLLEGQAFIPHAQDIATAGATAVAKNSSTRSAFKRIWASKKDPLTKLYRSADEVFIQRGARRGANQAANIMTALIERHLLENSQTGPIAQRLTDLVVEHAQGLSAHMPSQVVEMNRREMYRRAIQDPESLPAQGVEFVGPVHGAKVQEIISKFTMEPPVQDFLVDKAIDGDLFRLMRTGELDTAVTEAIWHNIFASPELYLARIRELTRAVVEMPIDTLQELQSQIRLLEELNLATGHIVEQQMSATQVYTRDMRNLQSKDDVWQGQWENVIKPVMASGEDSARQIVEHLLRNLRDKGYNLSRQSITQYDELINKELIHIQMITKAREAINDFTRIMIDKRRNEVIPSIRRAGDVPNSTHPEMEAWWQEFQQGRDRIWKESQAERAEVIADISATAGTLDALPLPQPIDVSGRTLVMADVAYIYGAVPDAVTSGMYLADLKMMRPKLEWVNTVYAQARRVSQQTGGTPESVGFTKDRLGVLYDDHLRSLRIRPEVENLSAPQFVEWDALHKELQAYGLGKSVVLGKQGAKAMDDAAKGLLDAIRADPVAREVLSEGTVPILAPKVTRAMEIADLTSQVNNFVSARPEQELWFHGGVALEEGEGLTQGFITKDLDTAIGYAEDAARGRPDAGFVHVVDISDTGLPPERLVDNLGQPTDVSVVTDDIEEVVPLGSFDALAEGLGVPPITSGTESAWAGKRRLAVQDAVNEYNINFPVYDQHNAFNSAMRAVVPFWSYEAHRWMYLPRVAVRNPGLTHAWGTYSDNTDRGYIPVPGTSMQVSLTRSTIISGGMQRMVNRDYPEYYDQFPEFANFLDVMNRAGFYPNVFLSAFMASPFANEAGVSQLGEVLPAPIGSVLEAIIAIDPDNPAADALADLLLPNRFRDRAISIRLAENLPEGQEERAYDILTKRVRGEDLTDEEKNLWDNAERRASIDILINHQISLWRLKPPEMEAARKLSKEIILQYLPITSDQYDEARKLGLPIENYYPYPVELADELREIESLARWRGLSSQLGESTVGQMLAAQNAYWNIVEDRQAAKRVEEVELDRKFRTLGPEHITRDEWLRRKRQLDQETRQFIDDLKASPDYEGVPIEYEDRLAFAQEHKTLAPIQEPLEETIAYYFSKTPDDFRFYDPEVGSEVVDWNGFYKWRATLEDNLESEDRRRFLTRIRRFDTDLEGFRREDYNTYIRPHKNLWSVTLAEFTPEEQAIIRQFYAVSKDVGAPRVRKDLLDIESGGGKLIVGFQATLTERRKRLRILDPDIDARLVLWGETTQFATPKAQEIHDLLLTQYGIQTREAIGIEPFIPIVEQ